MKQKTLKQAIDILNDLGTTISNCNYCIVVTIYDYVNGRNLLHDIIIDKADAIRLFGDLKVYSIDPDDDCLAFTLHAPEEPNEEVTED